MHPNNWVVAHEQADCVIWHQSEPVGNITSLGNDAFTELLLQSSVSPTEDRKVMFFSMTSEYWECGRDLSYAEEQESCRSCGTTTAWLGQV